jgi:hypothetical protein
MVSGLNDVELRERIPKHWQPRKTMALLKVLVFFEIWQERNASVFRNHASTSTMLVSKIREEATLWYLARVKALSNVMP